MSWGAGSSLRCSCVFASSSGKRRLRSRMAEKASEVQAAAGFTRYGDKLRVLLLLVDSYSNRPRCASLLRATMAEGRGLRIHHRA